MRIDYDYEHAVEALRSLSPDMRILALADSVTRDAEAMAQERERTERENGNGRSPEPR